MPDFMYYEGLVFGLVATTFFGILCIIGSIVIYKVRTRKIARLQEKALEAWRREEYENAVNHLTELDPD